MSITKTGLITGKEFNEGLSNFTVVGNPTITDGGMVSNMSASNYLNTNITSINATSTIVVSIGGMKGNTQTVSSGLFMFASGDKKIIFYINQYNDLTKYVLSGSTASYLTGITMTDNTSFNATYTINLTNSTISHTLYQNGSLIDTKTSNVTLFNLKNDFDWSNLSLSIIGTNYLYSTLNATIDLSQFSISVDNKVIYSPAVNKGSISSYQITSRNFIEV